MSKFDEIDKTSGDQTEELYDLLQELGVDTDYGAIDLTDLLRITTRRGINVIDAQRILARLKAANRIGAEQIGHSFYIIINP